MAKAQHSVTKLWQTDTVLNIPESVLHEKDVLYVSLIDGDAWAADGKGGVGTVSIDGKIKNTSWITGLNAPKGMARVGDRLYVADLNEVAVIDIKKGAIDHKIAIPGAAWLNDVTADKKGTVYVTDSKNGTAYKIEGDKATLFLEGIKGINGIKAVADKVYVLGGDAMYLAGNDKKATKFAELEHGGDGLEPIGNGDFLATAWSGYLYYIKADGTKELLLDTHETKNKTADIGYDPKTRIIYVPTFLGKSVVAYKLN
ncbi:ATP-binding protein [Mucilaginibacter pedocola]|uniref:ATP-binding protein n=2 Tax=Mucilaginibacter pedocola TaxID=1792845 RepID=A0A1S9PAF7_9SPHI|nr:ATP-binding protein [Mucilaginibacter pedocola]